MIVDVPEGRGTLSEMIVMKFGGSSVESAAAIERVVSIVKSYQQDSPVVVVSAMGKTTDRLACIGQLASEGKTSGQKLGAAILEMRELEMFHLRELRALAPGSIAAIREVTALFESAVQLVVRISAAGSVSPRHSDALLSYGERLSSIVVATALQNAGVPAIHLDAQSLILTDHSHTKAAPLYWETYAKLRRAIPTEKSRQVAVIGGFIGATESGTPTTLGRGGSDFTAALVGAAINAEEIQIWTDVDGMLSCDPRVLPGGRCLRQISYAEAAEMAEWGAKVLHPATVAPAMRQRVPVSIRNSRHSAHPGTRIECAPLGRGDGLVKSIACQKNLSLFRVHPLDRRMTPQFVAWVKSVFSAHQTDFRALNGKKSVELVVSECGAISNLLSDLSVAARVEVEQGLASVSVIGNGIEESRGLFSYAVRTMANCSVPFHAMGTSPMRISFVVAEQELNAATMALHDGFVKFQEAGPFWSQVKTLAASAPSRQRFAARPVLATS
jgi:aspartate kinase